MNKDELKYKVFVRIHEGQEAAEIADDLSIPLSRVVRYRGEYKAAVAEGTLQKVINMDQAAIDMLGSELVRDLPKELQPDAEATIEKIQNGKLGIDRLGMELQNTAIHLNNRIRTLSMSIEHVSEIVELSKALCEIQNAFFNKNQTQVNVQNNYGDQGSSGYGEFLGDKPGE